MGSIERARKVLGVAHVFVDQPISQVAGLDPIDDRAQQAKLLHSIQVVEGRSGCLQQLAPQFRDELVPDGVLHPAEAGHEGIDALGRFRLVLQVGHPACVYRGREQSARGPEELMSFPRDRVQQEQEAVPVAVAHRGTPVRRATVWMGCGLLFGSTRMMSMR